MPQGVYTLRNYGQPLNCSLSILFPQSINIISMISNSIKPLIEGTNLEKKPSNYYDYQLNRNQTQIDDLNDQKLENTIQSDNVSRFLRSV